MDEMIPQNDIFMETTNNMLCMVHNAQDAYAVAKLTEDKTIVPEKLLECKGYLKDLRTFLDQAESYVQV